MSEWSSFFTPMSAFGIIIIIYFRYSDLTVVLHSIFLITKDVEHPFVYIPVELLYSFFSEMALHVLYPF